MPQTVDIQPGATTRALGPPAFDGIRDGGSRDAHARNALYGSAGLDTHRDQWWMPARPNRPMTALGIHGQLLWVSPDAGIVMRLQPPGERRGRRERPTAERRQAWICWLR